MNMGIVDPRHGHPAAQIGDGRFSADIGSSLLARTGEDIPPILDRNRLHPWLGRIDSIDRAVQQHGIGNLPDRRCCPGCIVIAWTQTRGTGASARR